MVLQNELDYHLIRRGRTGPISSFVLLALLLITSPAHRTHPIALAWMGASLLAATGRLWVIESAKRRSRVWGMPWKRAYRAAIVVHSFLWASLAIWTIRTFGVTDYASFMVTIMMVGVTAGQTTTLGSDPGMTRTSVGILLLYPSAVLGLTAFSGVWKTFSFVYVIYFGFLWNQTEIIYRLLVENIQSTLRFQNERNQLQSILDSIPGFVSYFTPDLTYRGMNRRLIEALGGNFERYLGKPLGFQRTDDQFIDEVRRFALSQDPVRIVEMQLRLKGESRWHLLTLNRMPELAGDILCVSIDIHEKKELEEENLRHRAKVESSAKMAALGEMAGGLAHEINTPLAVIQGYARQLREHVRERVGTGSAGAASPAAVSPSARGIDATWMEARAMKIENHSQRIARIIRGLRNFSRSNEGDPMKIESLREVVSETLEFCTERMRMKLIRFELAIPLGLAIRCRAAEIGQVFLNLLNNAVDAIDSGGEAEGDRLIRVEARRIGDRVEIAVTDSGPGIPVELRGKVMQPFFTTKDVGKGTGLGLSISKGIVEDHGGKFSLDTDCKRTRFLIELPLATADAEGDAGGGTGSAEGSGAGAAGSGKAAA